MGGGRNSTGTSTSHGGRKPGSANTEQKLDEITDGDSRRKEYNVFISHSWDYGDQYDRLKDLLDDKGHFNYKDYSVPEDEELDPDEAHELWNDMKTRIKNSSAVVVTAGMYVSHSNWIRAEINMAKSTGTPVVAVKPRGNENLPSKVQEEADKVVGWNKESVVEAIREVSE
ncbi:MAG: TIR domain-containing protein [Candidatus Nanohaloarchaea archaeon]